MINNNLLQLTLKHFNQVSKNQYTVNPSIPILYFGDEVAYRSSVLKVITVAKNPSLNEFCEKVIVIMISFIDSQISVVIIMNWFGMNIFEKNHFINGFRHSNQY